MAYQENVEVYLTLTYKELQGLCRKHRLPDNKSKTELARVLVEFFKRRALLKEKKKNRSAASLQQQGPAVRRGERRGEGDASAAKRPAAIPTPKKKEGVGKCSQMAGQLETNNQSDTQASGKVLNTFAEKVRVGPSSLLIEGLDCSTSESLLANAIPPLAIGTHESVPRLSSGQEYGASCDGSTLQTLFNGKTPCQNILSVNASLEGDGNDLPLFKFSNKHSGESSGESGLDILSNEISGEAYPSFQFFVRADEGINLFVDLNSSPSDWVKKLKCEVCIYQNPQKNSWSISSGIKESGNVEEHLKISYPNDMEPHKDVCTAQLNDLGAKDEHTIFSLKPIVDLDCNCPVSSNGMYESLPAKALASDRYNKEQPECLVKGNQTISSLDTTCFDVKRGSNPCPMGYVEKHILLSTVDNDRHSSLPDGFSVANLHHMNNLTHTTVDAQEPSELLTLESDLINSRAKPKILGSPGNVPSRFGDNSNTSLETTLTNKSERNSYANLPGNRQSDGRLPRTVLNDFSVCCSLGNTASRDSVPVLTDELGAVKALLKEDTFKLLDIKSLQLTNSKRLLNSDTLEQNLRKKQCVDPAHQDLVQKFRTMKSPAKDRLSDSGIQPRRSTRLVSK